MAAFFFCASVIPRLALAGGAGGVRRRFGVAKEAAAAASASFAAAFAFVWSIVSTIDSSALACFVFGAAGLVFGGVAVVFVFGAAGLAAAFFFFGAARCS